MADIHLLGGERGGVGKSTGCRALMQTLLDYGLPFCLYETDRSNSDCLRTYGHTCEAKVAIFSEGERYDDAANQLYLSGIRQRTVVNLPAQVLPALKRWLLENDILSLAAEDEVRFVHWFFSNGSYDSHNLFRKYVTLFPTMTTIFVKNEGITDDWSGFEEDTELQAFITERGIPVLTFPRFHGAATRNRIDARSLTFGQVRDRTGDGAEGFSSIDRRRVKTFLDKASAMFLASRMFPEMFTDAAAEETASVESVARGDSPGIGIDSVGVHLEAATSLTTEAVKRNGDDATVTTSGDDSEDRNESIATNGKGFGTVKQSKTRNRKGVNDGG